MARFFCTARINFGDAAPFVRLSAELASTASPMQDLYEDMDGEIVLEPGTSYQLQAAAAGSTPNITAGVTWEEIAVV
jgi:hypothetical protein